jgi:hypothetical protein
MSWEDISATAPEPAATPDPETAEPVPTTRVDARPSDGFIVRRGIATALLATGLLVLGGAAVVNAADPSTSPAPSQTTSPDGSGTAPSQTDPSHGGWGQQPGTQGQGRGHHGPGAGAQGGARGDCPNMGGDQGSNGGSAPTTPTTPDPTTTPSGDPSDV